MALLLALALAACRPDSGVAGPQAPDELSLQPGDLLYRLGNGLYSAYFRNFSQTDQRFSHVGIVVQATPTAPLHVVHAEADDFTGQGGVRSERLADFLKGANDWAVYRLNREDTIRQDIAARALGYYRRGIPFDLAFDTDDTSAFYCTELVLHCVNEAVGSPLLRAGTVAQGKRFVAIDDTYRHPDLAPVLQNANPEKPTHTFCTPL
jgi:hypothetical protein